MTAIEVHGLTKQFGSFAAVKGVSFDVKQGEIFGFLGKNGAGKSTTIHMLTGIVRPTAGNYHILVYPHTRLREIQRRIGVMPDAANYYYDLSAIGHMMFFAQLKKCREPTSGLDPESAADIHSPHSKLESAREDDLSHLPQPSRSGTAMYPNLHNGKWQNQQARYYR
ncbi:ATP-binding cassette domain-containing protein [Paenibacillus chartarius]|uniref:ATP-binding cassette domain-containing protein n=1 Tax=Paenibacillus chartarius TaxID=747481 RepID=A0ABV6DEF7_9BACL